jgi:DNA polymerase I-like protein with 3'-5' exonuclease and polymerase domains
MCLQVHDENIFEVREGEEELLKELSGIMARVYPHQHIPLTVGIDHSYRSWADKKEWVA